MGVGSTTRKKGVGGRCVGRQKEGGRLNRVNYQTKNSRLRSQENRVIAFRDCELGVRSVVRLVFLLLATPLTPDRVGVERGGKRKKKYWWGAKWSIGKDKTYYPWQLWEWAARSRFSDKLRSRKGGENICYRFKMSSIDANISPYWKKWLPIILNSLKYQWWMSTVLITFRNQHSPSMLSNSFVSITTFYSPFSILSQQCIWR